MEAFKHNCIVAYIQKIRRFHSRYYFPFLAMSCILLVLLSLVVWTRIGEKKNIVSESGKISSHELTDKILGTETSTTNQGLQPAQVPQCLDPNYPVQCKDSNGNILQCTTEGGNCSSGSANSQSLSSVLSWDQQIHQNLERGVDNAFNRMEADISNNGYNATKESGQNLNAEPIDPDGRYWCTFSVVDSYNLAGISGTHLPEDAAVYALADFWKQQGSPFIYLDYANGDPETILKQVKPGMAIFFVKSQGMLGDTDHTAIVESLNLDDNGNGELITLDSNIKDTLPDGLPGENYPVANWQIQDYVVAPQGFGGVQ